MHALLRLFLKIILESFKNIIIACLFILINFHISVWPKMNHRLFPSIVKYFVHLYDVRMNNLFVLGVAPFTNEEKISIMIFSSLEVVND